MGVAGAAAQIGDGACGGAGGRFRWGGEDRGWAMRGDVKGGYGDGGAVRP